MNQVVKLHTPEAAAAAPFALDHVTVRQVLDWHESNAARPIDSTDAEKERQRIWRLLRTRLGDQAVAGCRPLDALQFINDQKLGSNWSRKRWNATIQGPFNAAERLQLIARNPFRGLSFPQGENGRDWSDDEYRSLLRASTAVFRRLLVGIRFSGLRPGEARGLEWANVRPTSGAIVIEKHKTRYRTKRPRKLPMGNVVAKLLRWLKAHNPPGTRHVFLNSHGQPWSTRALTKRIDAIRKKVDLPPQVKLHGGRHTFATGAVMNGVELAALMEMMGHGQLATTQRYLHVTDKVDHLQASMDQAVKIRRKPRPQRDPVPPAAPLFDGLE